MTFAEQLDNLLNWGAMVLGNSSPYSLYETRSRDENGADLLTVFAFNFHFSVPADSNQLGETPSIILIALVHAHR